MSVQIVSLQASAAQVASGNTNGVSIPTATMAQLILNISVDDFTDFDAWLEAAATLSGTYVPVVPDWATIEGAPPGTATVLPTTCLAVDSAAAVGKFGALYRHLPAAFYRLRWALTGTSITFDADLVVK